MICKLGNIRRLLKAPAPRFEKQFDVILFIAPFEAVRNGGCMKFPPHTSRKLLYRLFVIALADEPVQFFAKLRADLSRVVNTFDDVPRVGVERDWRGGWNVRLLSAGDGGEQREQKRATNHENTECIS